MNKLIMVVDDDQTTLQLLSFRFRQLGYAVLKVSSSEGALALIRAVLPDLIIVDLKMPGLPGIELCHKLRAMPLTQSTPIIVYSNATDADMVKRVQAIPDTIFMSKSQPLDQLLAEAVATLKKIEATEARI